MGNDVWFFGFGAAVFCVVRGQGTWIDCDGDVVSGVCGPDCVVVLLVMLVYALLT